MELKFFIDVPHMKLFTLFGVDQSARSMADCSVFDPDHSHPVRGVFSCAHACSRGRGSIRDPAFKGDVSPITTAIPAADSALSLESSLDFDVRISQSSYACTSNTMDPRPFWRVKVKPPCSATLSFWPCWPTGTTTMPVYPALLTTSTNTPIS